MSWILAWSWSGTNWRIWSYHDSQDFELFQRQLLHSPEVELTEIFVSNIFNGNGLAPSDKPPDTKNTTRGVHNFRILKIL